MGQLKKIYNLEGLVIEQNIHLPYRAPTDRIHWSLEPARADTSRILQVVKPHVDIVL